MPESPPLEVGRPPQSVFPGLWLFAPSREIGGGSAWLLDTDAGRVLIDTPALTEANRDVLVAQPPCWHLLTSREGHGRARRWQQLGGWRVLVQEQEAYLLPGVERLETFSHEAEPVPGLRLLWTPGPTPGACVVWSAAMDGLFCGRLLVPIAPARLAPLRTSRTFHWPRQLQSVAKVRAWLPPTSPGWIATGAGLGALRGEKLVDRGRTLLDGIDLATLKTSEPVSRPI
jgi:glyoxylase-like metal-dependent hydrolase (beta-lactamase superfamily II)